MITKQRTILTATAVACLLLGWFGGGWDDVASAQAPDPLTEALGEAAALALLSGYEWRMFGGNVAGTGGSGGSGGSDTLTGSTGSTGNAVKGATWLYNTKTGKVYRVFERCAGDEGSSGCLFAVPIFSADRLDDFLPNPATNDPPGRER